MEGTFGADSVEEGVSGIAAEAVAIDGVPGFALIADSCADTEGVEESSVCAFGTALAFPDGAEGVVASVEGVGVNDAGTVLFDVSSIAGQAFSGDVAPGVAEIADKMAVTIEVHPPSFGAFLADVVFPEGAS